MGTTQTSEAWRALERHQQQLHQHQLRDLFAQDPARATTFSVQAADLWIDYSKNLLTAETLQLLIRVAKESGVETARNAM